MIFRAVVLVSLLGVSLATCPSDWSPFWGKCYRYFGDATNWQEAEDQCVGYGSNLASANSPAEHNFLLQLVGSNRVWIGLNDLVSENNWAWTDGSHTVFNAWSPGEPNNSGGEDCTELKGENDKWNDLPCGATRTFVCEKHDMICPDNWQLFEGYCFHYSTDSTNFATAESRCQTMGGHLASIHSNEENDFVVSFAEEKSGSVNAPRTWMGYNDVSSEGQWVYTDGSVAMYSNWQAGEPNNAGGNQDCGWFPHVNRYEWDDISCSENQNYVCKKEAGLTSAQACDRLSQIMEYIYDTC